MSAKDKAENEAQLTAVAHERLTWEAAANMTYEAAARCFIQRNDDAARQFRALADAFDANQKDASRRQTELLGKLGR